jgi:glutaredoxin
VSLLSKDRDLLPSFAFQGKLYYLKASQAEESSPTHPMRERKSAMAQEQVKIYSLSTCSHCKSTKKFLSDCTIKYEFVDVDLLEGDERKAILEDVKKFNPKCSFPTIIIGDKVIVGFKENEIKEALGL